ncbi:hypothetical protein [Marinobacter sediminum]|uniref:hypothetical protein n=1 Tax=Marinobacter sediminum TaxID=256323 RepID=UPI00193A9009|nr:hypothetical protein [Marinobacter sediminum]
MKLSVTRLDDSSFPSLGWVVKVDLDHWGSVRAHCGLLVEAGSNYLVEGVWPGPFAELGFSVSERFFGSGFRILSKDELCFVSSCSTVDRIWCHQKDRIITLSNSLPCLLSVADINLLCSEDKYAKLVESIVNGNEYKSEFPVDHGRLHVHYFENVRVTKEGINIEVKPTEISPFENFDEYSAFLYDTAIAIGANAADSSREYPVKIFSTISRGYDSPVASVLAKAAGSKTAFTIKSARSLLPREDSGLEICKYLGLECKEFTNNRTRFRDELWYWAANGSLQDMNFSVFDYPNGPSAMFTGFNGDMVWSRGEASDGNYLKRKDSTGLGFCEHRLLKGVIHCPVPFWGIRQIESIKRISNNKMMAPWALGGEYDRPVPRRIAEAAGIPRECFGQRKSATTVDELILLPITRQLRNEYQKFLSMNYLPPLRIYTLSIVRFFVDLWRGIVRQRLIDFLRSKHFFKDRSKTFAWENFLFPWANQKLKTDFAVETDVSEELSRT